MRLTLGRFLLPIGKRKNKVMMPRINATYTSTPQARKKWNPFQRRRNRRRGFRVILFWWIPLELALVALVTWGLDTGVRMLADPMTLPVKDVKVLGKLHYLNPNTLEEVIIPVATGGFLRVDIREVRKAALTLPWVEDAHVRRLWPDTLRVTVTEQVPVARWMAGGLINGRGELFTPDPSTYPDNLPTLGGTQGTTADMLDHLHRLDQAFAPFKLTVTTLQVDERRAWTITLSNGIQLLLGKKDLDNRLARFLHVYPSALGSQAERIARVDLRYSNGFAVGWKQAG
ncbi:cell division protein FtsQ [Gammaproteobacteria bacterium]